MSDKRVGRVRRSKPSEYNAGVVRYFTTFQNTIADVLASRGWQEVREGEEFDFVWADREWVYNAFDRMHLESWQRLNHFRNGRELCRKDLMAKNMKKRRRALEKEGRHQEAELYNFIPTTFVLPREYALFVEEFKRNAGVWIMKPIGSAQGKGIFLFTKLNEISEWKTDFKSGYQTAPKDKKPDDVEAYVVQRYIQYPYLIGGKKFDMRLYVLISSFSPLKVYQYRRGFARFTNSRYSSDTQDIYDDFMHLTNVAIQKSAADYDDRTGNKMELQALKMYLMTIYGQERVDALFWEMQMVILRSLLAVSHVMINDRHCFEVYGYDLLIDEDLKPWLIEVNASPSLSANTREDFLMKTEMLHGMLDVVDMDQVLSGDEEHVSGWDLVYDNGYIEIDPTQCGYTSFMGTAIPEPDFVVEPTTAAAEVASPPPKAAPEEGRMPKSSGRSGSGRRGR
jgi:tubulin polyglutamylase TTLL9